MSYVFQNLSIKKTTEIKKHLKSCKECQQTIDKIINMKEIIKETPDFSAANNIDYIVNTAEKRITKKEEKQHYTLWQLLSRFKLGYVMVTVSVFIILFFLILMKEQKARIYLTKVSGKTIINNISFFNNRQFDLSDNNKIHIVTKNGKATIQIDNNKIIILQPYTDIILYNRNNIKVHLKRGAILCSANKLKNKDDFSIESKEVLLNIIGTTFMVQKGDDFTKLSVNEGKVLSTYKQGSLIITNNQYCIFKEDGIVQGELNQNNNFQELLSTGYINNFNQVNIIVQTNYIKNEYLFHLIQKQKKENILKPREIKEEISSDYQLIKKYRLPKRVLSRPNKIKDILMIQGADGYLLKYDLTKQKIIWQIRIKKIKNKKSYYLDGIVLDHSTTPVYHKNRLCFVSNDGYLYLIDFITHRIIWKRKVGTIICSKPVIYKGNIYMANTEGIVFCLDLKRGDLNWFKQFKKGFYSNLLIKRDTLYIGNANGSLYALNINTQKIKWKFKTGKPIINSKPIIIQDQIYFGSSDHYFYALEFETGEVEYKYKTDSKIITSPVQINDIIILASSKGTVYGFDYKEEELKWKYQCKGKIKNNPDIYKNQYAVYGDDKHNIYFLNQNGSDFFKWNIKHNHFLIIDEEIMINQDKNIYNYKVKY